MRRYSKAGWTIGQVEGDSLAPVSYTGWFGIIRREAKWVPLCLSEVSYADVETLMIEELLINV